MGKLFRLVFLVILPKISPGPKHRLYRRVLTSATICAKKQALNFFLCVIKIWKFQFCMTIFICLVHFPQRGTMKSNRIKFTHAHTRRHRVARSEWVEGWRIRTFGIQAWLFMWYRYLFFWYSHLLSICTRIPNTIVKNINRIEAKLDFNTKIRIWKKFSRILITLSIFSFRA